MSDLARILYIEDEPQLAELFQTAVGVNGRVVDTMPNGRDGLAKHFKEPYDLVAVDLRLPDIDGMEVIRRLLEDDAQLPIIVVTGKGSEEVAAEALALGVANYIIKGNEEIYSRHLPRIIEQLLQKSKASRETKIRQQEQENRISMALKTAKMGTWEWNVRKDTHVWDDHLKAMFGVPPDKFKGMMVEDFLKSLHEDDLEAVEEAINGALAEEKEYDVDYRVIWPDGDIHWLNARAEVIRDEDGRPLHMIGACVDITERKQAEEQRKVSEGRFIDVVDGISDYVTLYDADDQLIIANSNMKEAFPEIADVLIPGTPAEEVIRAFGEKLVHPDSRDDGWIEDTIARHADGVERDLQYFKDGRRFGLRRYRTRDGGMLIIRSDVTERIQAEEALRKSEEHLNSIVTNTAEGIITIDENGIIETFNPAAERIFGYGQSETVGKNVSTLMSPEEGKKHLGYIEKSDLHEPRIVNQARDLFGQRKDGRVFPMEITVSRADVGGRKMYIGIMHDISERKKAEEAVVESEVKYRNLFESANDSIFVIDPDGLAFLDVNENAAKRLGYTRAELLDMTVMDITVPDLIAADLEYAAKLQEAGNITFETVYLAKDGARIPVEISARNVDFGGRRTIQSFVRDITGRKRAEKQARDNEATLRSFLNAFSGSAVLFDRDGRIVEANERVAEKYGKERNEVVGSRIQDLIPQHLQGEGNERVRARKKAFRTGEPLEFTDTLDEKWRHVTFFPLKDSNGEVTRVASFTSDITAQKEGEEELRQAKEQADTANRAKSDFLSSMSHELRTPMNAILGFAQMLDFNPKEPLTEAQKSSVDHILKGGQHLLSLINDILDLAQIESGKFDLSPEHFFPRDVFKECLELVRGMADEHSITLSAKKECDQGIHVDRVRFKQVMVNLLSNAIKYNKESGSVTFGCQDRPDGTVHIYVSDTGRGILEDRIPQLFEPFERLDSGQSEIEGTGIGLTISKRLVEAMGGVIGCESTVGEGTTFWIEFPPLEEAQGKAAPGGGDEGKNLNGAEFPAISGTLLYVEDNPENLELMELIVARIEGLSMISAPNAEQGVERARAEKPDLIILDINLPGMSGVQAMKKLRRYRNTKNIPVLALSAAATERDMERGSKAGFSRYLTKPIQVAELVSAIKKGLEA